jgi:hypothetical protein
MQGLKPSVNILAMLMTMLSSVEELINGLSGNQFLILLQKKHNFILGAMSTRSRISSFPEAWVSFGKAPRRVDGGLRPAPISNTT